MSEARRSGNGLRYYMERFYRNCYSAPKWKRILLYIMGYTLVFVLTFLLTYSPFLTKGTSFVWIADGRNQDYPFLVYYGRLLRRTVYYLLDGEIRFPLYDVALGMGDDIIGLLNVHGVTNPIMLVSALVPVKYSEYLYAFLIIFLLYLAGISFSWLCFYYRKKAIPTLTGSVLYVFSGYAIMCSMRHPFFLNPMYLLPILIIGTDKILKRERPYVFLFGVWYSVLCGYYHLYMMTILIAVFAIVRFFEIYRKNRLKEFCLAFVRGIGTYGLGIGLAGIIFFPAIMEFFNAGRAGHSIFTPYKYTIPYFLTRVIRLFAPSPSTGWVYPALAAIAVPALTVLAVSKGNRTLKILVMAAFAIYFTDIGNYMMNGFQYPSERWTFGLVLIIAYATVEMLPKLFMAGTKEKIGCVIVVSACTVVTFFTLNGRKLTYSVVGVCWLALTMMVLAIGWKEKEYISQVKKNVWGGICHPCFV